MISTPILHRNPERGKNALQPYRRVIVSYTHEFPEWKNREDSLDDFTRHVPMNIEDFFLPADSKVEYCPADPELVEMNLDFYRGEE